MLTRVRTVAALLAVCSLALVTAARADAVLQQAIDEALKPGVTGTTRLAVVVMDPRSGAVVARTPNAGEPFIPASNLKLVTSATTLDTLGPDATLPTTLLRRGSELWLVGSGDPALGDPTIEEQRGRTPMSVLSDFAEAVKKAGVQRVTRLVVSDPVFDEQLVHPSWHPGNLQHWYGAPVAGLSFNDNCVDFTFKPTTVGQRARVETLPPAGGFRVTGTAKTGLPDQHAPTLDKRPGSSHFVVGGTVGRTDGPYSKPVHDPRAFVGEALRETLRRAGVTVGEVVVTTAAPPEDGQSQTLAVHHTALTDVLRRVNSNSQNMMSEACAKLNGLAFDRAGGDADARGSWAGGQRAAVAFFGRIGLDPSGLMAADGSGLSRDNRASADQLAGLLTHMLVTHEHGEAFLDSLALSGKRGSLRRRLEGLDGRVYGKTGTISGVSTLSGYLFGADDQVLVFSILHNGIEGSSSPLRRQQDDAVRAIAAWMDARDVQAPAIENVDELRALEAAR
jgi:serine-type D-Ala-D-Ala carboxypeptidase/endopeptidase (penicillin-binding protein 4)